MTLASAVALNLFLESAVEILPHTAELVSVYYNSILNVPYILPPLIYMS